MHMDVLDLDPTGINWLMNEGRLSTASSGALSIWTVHIKYMSLKEEWQRTGPYSSIETAARLDSCMAWDR